jgi:lactate dehydrogenase-like 2-hydroxyacid dehydrogenase
MGIIGFGTTGQMVARAACGFGMKVLYYSRTRKPEREGKSVRYAPLLELLSQMDAATTHLPRNTRLLDATAFAAMKPGAVLINTSLGPTFELPAFCDWIERGGSHVLFDADGAVGCVERIAKYPTVVVSDKTAGFTAEARSRLTAKVLDNIQAYLQNMTSPS